MNITAIVIAVAFTVLSLAFLLVLILGKRNPLSTHRFKNYFVGSAGVHLSGTVLIMCFAIFMAGLPTSFVIIAELTITFVFVFTLAILYRMSLQIDDIQKAIAEGKARSAEQVAQEDAEFEALKNEKDNSENS